MSSKSGPGRVPAFILPIFENRDLGESGGRKKAELDHSRRVRSAVEVEAPEVRERD